MTTQTNDSSQARGSVSAIATLKRHWKLALILTLLSASAGVYSEVLASSFFLKPGSFSGAHLHAKWISGGRNSDTWTSADVYAQENFLLPSSVKDNVNQGRRATVVAADITTADWQNGTLEHVWAFAPIEHNALFVKHDLSKGGVSAEEVPASVETFLGGQWDNSEGTLNIAVLLENQQNPRRERSDTWHSDPLGERSSVWGVAGRLAPEATATGEISISFPDGTSNTLVSEETFSNWSELGQVQSGNVGFDTFDNSAVFYSEQ